MLFRQRSGQYSMFGSADVIMQALFLARRSLSDM